MKDAKYNNSKMLKNIPAKKTRKGGIAEALSGLEEHETDITTNRLDDSFNRCSNIIITKILSV